MTVNAPSGNTVAALANVALCHSALEAAMKRPAHLPGMVCMYGPAGFGKSTAAAYAANKTGAYYIECKSTWSRKAVLQAILKEMGPPDTGTIYAMTDQICEQLTCSERPLIVDEMDYLAEKKVVEIIRDLHEGSGAAILLIGEERLPKKLERWERFHSRILDWVPAQPADFKDCLSLAKLYCPEIEIESNLLEKVYKASDGSVRRICVNIEQIRTEAKNMGYDEITLEDWGTRSLYTGSAPARRL